MNKGNYSRGSTGVDCKQAESRDIGGKAISAFRWLATARFFGQFVTWVITLYVIRLLAPSDYGLMAIANFLVSILALLNELGLGAAVIQAEDLEKRILKQIFGTVIVINGVLFFLLLVASPFIAIFFGEPLLEPMFQVLSSQFIFIAFSAIPKSLLERELRFRQRSIIEFICSLLGGLVTLFLALEGKGVWALVWGSIAVSLARMIGLNLVAPFYPQPVFSFKGMRRFVCFGGMITVEGVIWYLYSQADIFIIGKVMGKELLGIYSVGKEIASLPLLKINPLVNQVVFPAISRIQDDLKEVARFVAKGIQVLSFIGFPIFLGISSTAEETVTVVLGQKWAPAAQLLTWMALALPLNMISGIIQTALKSVGKPSVSLRNVAVAFLIMLSAFLVGSQWGILGVSLAWTIGYPIYFVIASFYSSHFLGLRAVDVYKAMAKPAFSAILMCLSLFLVKLVSKGSVSGVPELGILVATGAAVYIGVEVFLDRESVRDVMRFVKG